MKPPRLSIVCSMYRSMPYLDEFYRRMRAAAERITNDFEMIFVDDGCPDDSEQKVRELASKDSRVKLIALSRNFGHFKATFAGLRFAKGELIYLTNCDLEEPPETLNRFFVTLTSENETTDSVGGFQINRKRGFFYRATASVFYRILHFAADLKGPQDEVFSRLMTRRFLNEALKYADEQHLLLMGIFYLTGFRQVFIGIEKTYKGSTSYSFWKKLNVFIDAITSFSTRPLFYISMMGLACVLPAMGLTVVIIVRKIFFSDYQAGWTSVVASIWFLGGLNIFCVGVVGIYIGRIFAQVKKRPNYIIRDLLNVDPEPLQNHSLLTPKQAPS